VNGEHANAVRRKVEAWLAEPDAGSVIALRAAPDENADQEWTVGSSLVRVVSCRTPLAVRAALHARIDDERLVLLTQLTDDQLGDGLLVHLSRNTVRSIDPWDLVRQAFGALELDPTLVQRSRWAAEPLTDYEPPGGWPRLPGRVLTREHALRCLAAELLGVDAQQIDSAGLLQWTTNAQAMLRFRALPPAVTKGIADFLAEIAGPAAVPIMTAVRTGHGIDVLPIGLLSGLLWPAVQRTGPHAIAGRARLESRVGKPTDDQAAALREATEAWLDRTHGSDRQAAAQMLRRAEALAVDIEVTELLAGSPLLPTGFLQRLQAFAAAVRMAMPAGQVADPDAVAKAQALLPAVAEHRAADAGRVETARMALRLLRWLSTVDGPAPATLYDAMNRQVRVDGWVDRARLDVFAGETDTQVRSAYTALYQAVDARRARHDRDFARLLAATTASDAEPRAMLRVEDVLDRVVQPIVDAGRRVLMLVMDGMSTAAATELAESLTRGGTWLELTPGGGPRVGVLAALPTITEVSRCSLLSGRITVGQAAAEVKAMKARFPDGEVLHKGKLRAGAGAAFPDDVVRALANPACRIVTAVVNTIDDALDRSDPGTVVWGQENIVAVRDLLTLAQDRVVVLVSDHGHVIDRGPEATQRSVGTSENRWRPADQPATEDEVLIHGRRVAKGGGTVVLPWREELRYGPRKSGYHGGASPAEAVIPLVILSAGDEAAVLGWSAAPVASPDWWREPLVVPEQPSAPVRPAPPGPARPGRTKPEPRGDTLFELGDEATAEVEPKKAPAAAEPSLVQQLLAGEIYKARRSTRAPLPDERVAALLDRLIAGKGRASLDTLAAHAGIPQYRVRGAVNELTRVLQVEGYPVLTMDPDGQTVLLNIVLLREQFQL
jgi:PglZ domain